MDTPRRPGNAPARSYYHQKPRWLVHTTEVADPGPRNKSPFYFFFDHFDQTWSIVGWIAVNIALGQIAQKSHLVASAQGWLVVLLGFYLALNSRRLIIVFAMASYVAVGDTFWRMTNAGVPWETSKYVTIAMCIIILVRWIGRPQSGYCTAILLLILPGLIEGVQAIGFNDIKANFGFVILGTVLLAIASMVTRRLRCTWEDMRMVLWAMIGPVCAIASITLTSVSKLTAADYTSIQSNNAAAGNFGANQVGAALGLGALFAMFLAIHEHKWINRMLCLLLLFWFVGQSAATLSRGGLVAAALAMLAAGPLILLHNKLGIRFLMALTCVGLVAGIVILPRLDSYTNGAVDKRFHDTNSTERGNLASIDIQVFASHPIFGVGIGASDKYHKPAENGLAVASHTEWTRLLAEHGIFGLGVMLCELGLAVEAYRRQRNWFGRAWTIGLVAWVIADLSAAATRNAMNTFVFALALLAIDDQRLQNVLDVDEEVFGRRAPDLELDADAEPEPQPTQPVEASARDRQAAARQLRRSYRASLQPNTGSPIEFERDPLDPLEP